MPFSFISFKTGKLLTTLLRLAYKWQNLIALPPDLGQGLFQVLCMTCLLLYVFFQAKMKTKSLFLNFLRKWAILGIFTPRLSTIWGPFTAIP